MKEKGQGRPEGAPKNQDSVSPKEQAKPQQKSTKGNPLLSPVEQQVSEKSSFAPSGEAHTKPDRVYMYWLRHRSWLTDINPDPKAWLRLYKKYQEKLEKRAKEREKRNEPQKRYYQRNKEIIKDYKRRWRQRNKEKIRERERRYKQKQEYKEKRREYAARYREENREKVLAYKRRYHQKRKEQRAADLAQREQKQQAAIQIFPSPTKGEPMGL
jgi:hypothetical protein